MIDIERLLCLKRLRQFFKHSWHIIEPGVTFQNNWHLDALCLPHESRIATEDGYKKIGDIVRERYNGKVLSWNHNTENPAWKKIISTFESPGKPLFKIGLEDGRFIRLTGNHPVFIVGRGYVRADKVRTGDKVKRMLELPNCVQTGTGVPQSSKGKSQQSPRFVESYISSIEREIRIPDSVFNIEVEGNNNYFAEDTLIHNCEHLEAVNAGQIRNLLINIPPRFAKSISVAVMWPVWTWLKNPSCQWLFTSYAQSLSTRDSLKCRRLIESPWFQERFGTRFKLTSDQNEKMRFDNDRNGYRLATSVEGMGTGQGANTIVCDDPHNASERESELKRENVLVWWDETMSTRLNDPKTGAKVIVMQRLHEKDLSGHVLKQGGYEHLCLPAEFDPARRCTTSIGWTDPRKEENELLWPDRVGPKEIKELKLRLGPTGYAGQFQQIPTDAKGGRFKKAWFRYFDVKDGHYRLFHPDGTFQAFAVDDCDHFAFMDPAGSEKKQNNKPCYTVIGSFALTPDHHLLWTDMTREQVDTPAVVDLSIAAVRRGQLPWIGVEKDGLGLGVVQTIKKRGIAVRAIKAKGSKEARSETAEIRMSAGMIYFRQSAPWLFELEKELLLFPNSEFLDQTDVLAHTSQYVQQRCGAPAGEGDSFPSPVSDILEEREAVAAAKKSAQVTNEDWDRPGMWEGDVDNNEF
jgi:predicted phage terminase large subunit-like protein